MNIYNTHNLIQNFLNRMNYIQFKILNILNIKLRDLENKCCKLGYVKIVQKLKIFLLDLNPTIFIHLLNMLNVMLIFLNQI